MTTTDSKNAETSCCGGKNVLSLEDIQLGENSIHDEVKAFYADAAKNACGCQDRSERLYEETMLTPIHSELDTLSLGCGNPIIAAELKIGETVLDLGSGGGLDCFLAAQKVGESGRVIGIDMTPEMITRAEAAAEKLAAHHVSFRLGYLEEMPVENDSIDVVISNCVINLSPDKDRVFKEIFRVLKPGGRIAVSDIVIHGEIPPAVLQEAHSWSSCKAGALNIKVYAAGLEAAGLRQIAYFAKDDKGELLEALPENQLFSAIIQARKPKG